MESEKKNFLNIFEIANTWKNETLMPLSIQIKIYTCAHSVCVRTSAFFSYIFNRYVTCKVNAALQVNIARNILDYLDSSQPIDFFFDCETCTFSNKRAEELFFTFIYMLPCSMQM